MSTGYKMVVDRQLLILRILVLGMRRSMKTLQKTQNLEKSGHTILGSAHARIADESVHYYAHSDENNPVFKSWLKETALISSLFILALLILFALK